MDEDKWVKNITAKIVFIIIPLGVAYGVVKFLQTCIALVFTPNESIFLIKNLLIPLGGCYLFIALSVFIENIYNKARELELRVEELERYIASKEKYYSEVE